MKNEDVFAFPGQALGEDGLPSSEASPGMTLHEWYTGQALTGLLAGGEFSVAGGTEEHIAALASIFADAMMAERAKRAGSGS